jgi:hypothetical protein
MIIDYQQVRPDALSAYLVTNEWVDEGASGNHGGGAGMRIWTRGAFEVAAPLRADFWDYALRMSQAIDALRRAEGRHTSEVALDLVNSGYDVIRVRIMSAQAQEGVLPLEDAADYVQSSRDMLLAAACSEVTPRLYYPARKPAQANEFIRRVKFGQTDRGSFIFSLMTPIAPRLAEPQATEPDPFERRVTKKLLSAILGAKSAASEAASERSIAAFEQGRDAGVSANLCSALAKLSGPEDSEHDVELGFSWALVDRSAGPSRTERLPRTFAPLLRSAASALKAKAPAEDVEVTGPVLKLSRDDGVDVGRVVIASTVDGTLKKVSVELGGVDYQTALSAHGEQAALSATGTLQKEGKLYRLRNAREVHSRDLDADDLENL